MPVLFPFQRYREYLDHILLENEVKVDVIHNTRDPYFGGYAPDCTSVNLSRLRDVMRTADADLGLATDGDGDRFGLLDRGARMCDSSVGIALILDYLARRRGLTGAVGRTLATPTLIDAVADDLDIDVIYRLPYLAHVPMEPMNCTAHVRGDRAEVWAAQTPQVLRRDCLLEALETADRDGFQGTDDAGQITNLGRGGSDTTAVALAAALQADRCEIYSDVDGVYSADPRQIEEAKHLPAISYPEMQEMATAGAGAEASALDASTAIPFYNPAGMTRLEGKQVIVGFGLALLLNRSFPMKGLVTTLLLLPMMRLSYPVRLLSCAD